MRTNATTRFPAVLGVGKAWESEETPLPSTFADWTKLMSEPEEELADAVAEFAEKPATVAAIAPLMAKICLHLIVPVLFQSWLQGFFFSVHLVCQCRIGRELNELLTIPRLRAKT
jgi:hypothetical protein